MILQKPAPRYWRTEGAPFQSVFGEILTNSQHLLIGGTTGSGKSVLINGLITTAITTETPAEIGLILIDPKKIELTQYENLPHTVRYADETRGIIDALTVAVKIMDGRLAELKRKRLKAYDGGKIIIVIDELGDLLSNPAHTAAEHRQIVGLLQHIIQLGRAAKVYILAATQSPSRQTIPAAIRLNFTDFVALRCATAIESRQVIGEPGAEKLPRFGAALYRTPSFCGVQEIKIPFLPDDFIAARCAWWYTAASRPFYGTA